MADTKASAAAASMPDPTNQEEMELTPEQLQTQFQTLAAEADLYSQKNSYQQAIERYTAALNIHPNDKNCLVCRSRCYLQSGNPQAALEDANTALRIDPDFFKAIFQKAEALYSLGDFEFALVYYHRGHKARSEMNEFRVGIQKAREAIENSIGNPKEIKIRNLAKGNFANIKLTPTTMDMPGSPQSAKKSTIKQGGFGNSSSDSEAAGTTFTFTASTTTLNPILEKKLLGELYDDKVYLKQLLQDEKNSPNPNTEIHQIVSEGLMYIDSRIEFWRQQNPLYARPKHHIHYYKLKKGENEKTGGSKKAATKETSKKGATTTTVKQSSKMAGAKKIVVVKGSSTSGEKKFNAVNGGQAAVQVA